MGFSYSEEQQAILDATNGFNMVVANAGVGKTEISSEFIVRAYEKEREILFPGKKVLTSEEQQKILKQFKVISFTVKAAGELTTRVYKKFEARGIPIPMAFDKPYALSRTCDSYLQRWLTHPMVMQKWFEWDTRWRAAMLRIFQLLPNETKSYVKGEAAKLRGEYTVERVLHKLWGPLADEKVKDALFLAVSARPGLFQQGRGLVNEIRAITDKYIQSIKPHKGRWSEGLFPMLYERITHFQEPFVEKERGLEHLSLEDKVKLEADLKPWMKTRSLAMECGGVYDLARSIGYHPVHAKDNIATRLIVEKIATCDVLSTFSVLQSVALEVEELKAYIGAMDFGDFMQFTKTTFEKSSYILEKKKEYPTFGIRGKYVIWDEAQDNSLWQYWLLNQLCGAPTSNFHCLVLGDPKQAIYSFRGGNADEFVRNIRFLKEHAPKHLYGLTTSYRSCKKIVAIGNQVGRMLPAARVEAMDSKGVYHEEGDIIVAPPLKDTQQEFEYVKKQYAQIRQQYGKDSSVMLLVRSGIFNHPCSEWVDKLKDPNVCILTQHRSKGLEADHVFLLGCTAGKYPDPRSSIEDEVNLFYVAVTRPRMILYVCAPIILESEDGDEKVMGPSPFLMDTPLLKVAALKAGWTEEQLKKGVQAHKGQVGMFVSKLKERRTSLLEEAKRLFPEVPEGNLTRRKAMDTGARWKRQYRDPDKMHIKPKPLEV